MEQSRSDHPPQTVSCRDRQHSQMVSRSDQQPLHDPQMVSRSDQPLQDPQMVSRSDPQPSQFANNDYLTRGQAQARHIYTLPPSVSRGDLTDMEIARGGWYSQPNDGYTQRQRDLLDMDEDVGSEDDWKYAKDDGGDVQSEKSCSSAVASPHARGDGPPPPPPATYKGPPTLRCRGPPPPPQHRVVQPPPCKHLPPTPMPPAVPRRSRADTLEPHAQPQSDLADCDTHFRPKSDAAIHGELLELAPPCKSSEDLGEPTTLDKCSTSVIGVSNLGPYVAPRENHSNRRRFKDAQTLVNAHLSAASKPQLSRGSSGATRSHEEHAQDLIRRPAQPPPPLPSEIDPLRRHAQPLPSRPSERATLRRPAQPAPPLPPPCYCLEYFKTCVQLTSHWDQHLFALERIRGWCRTRRLTSVVLDSWPENILQEQPRGSADWRADRPPWCWGNLLAQLTDDSLRRVVEGTQGASGIVACMAREGPIVDGRERSAADQMTSYGRVRNVLYLWEFAFLRNDGTVAFLRPSSRTCRCEYYYEGVATDESAVATQPFRNVTTPATDESLPEFSFGEDDDITCRIAEVNQHCPTNWFPNMSSLELAYPEGLVEFMQFRNTNHATRGSAFAPPPKRGAGGTITPQLRISRGDTAGQQLR